MKPTIAWKPTGDKRFASTRYRALLPCKYLKEAGWNCEIFNSENIDSYKLVIFQKGHVNEEDFDIAVSLKRRGVKTVLDICDNDFYNPNFHPGPQRKVENLKRMIEAVDLVSVSTETLGNVVNQFFEDKKIAVIDDALERLDDNFLIRSYFRAKNLLNRSRSNLFKIVWYGNNRKEPNDGSCSGIIDIPKIIPSLESLNSKIPISLMVISSSKDLFRQFLSGVSFHTEYQQWNQKSFPYFFKQNDLCIIPISIDPFTVCKTNNRVMLSLLMGVPVIADKIPSYEEFADFILFSNWDETLHKYAFDSVLRRNHVEAGKAYILSNYGKDRVVSQYSSLFKRLLVNDLDSISVVRFAL